MKKYLLTGSLISTLAALAALVACGANSASNNKNDGGGGYSGTGSAGTSGIGGTSGDPDAMIFPDVNTDQNANNDATCAGQSVSGETFPLDMFIMLDQSGSMSDPIGTFPTPASPTKYSAVVSGLTSFFNQQPATVDMGVGIQFFPLFITPWDSLPTCDSGTACASSSNVCVEEGMGSTGYSCFASCTSNSTCGDGECYNDGSGGYCTNESCNAATYANPDVPIAPLAQSGTAVIAALNANGPTTSTPTVPALTGALQYTFGYANTVTGRKVIVVLATDGLPDECPDDETTSINQLKTLAQQYATGNPPVLTFVIGLVSTGDGSKPNLNAIAAAGGTTAAMIVSPNTDMANQFATALNAIRGQAVGCQFKMPTPEAGTIDLTQVNVVYTDNGGPDQIVYHVTDESSCDPTLGGWYYMPDNTNPTEIDLCPASCAAVQATGHQIALNIQMGCKTQDMPPK